MKRLMLIFLLFFSFSILFSTSGDPAKARDTLSKAAETLGWSSSLQDRSESGMQAYKATPTGQFDDEDKVSAQIFVASDEATAQAALDHLQDNGFLRSSFNGHDAIVTHKDDQMCNYKEFSEVGMGVWFVKLFFSPIAKALNPETEIPDKPCLSGQGLIAWRCGRYLFIGVDQTENGYETEIANAIYARADEKKLCGFGDTLVILADTGDRPGSQKLSKFETMTQDINSYYGQNGYGRIGFKYSFKDADGEKGTKDFFRVAPSLAPYKVNGGGGQFAEDALKKAFENDIPAEDLYFERVVVVFAGNGKQMDNTSAFSNACWWKDDNYHITVGGLLNSRNIYVKNYILLSENRELGGWVHEFGHSLYSKYQLSSKWNRISDRYNYDGIADRQFGTVYHWDLMGMGSHWGTSDGNTPTHMSGFTKESANWLTYKSASLNTSYELTAIENMKMGDSVLRVDDTEFPDARNFYIVEARDSSSYFGAPESGVVLYRVWYDTANDHYVVNALWPQQDKKVGSIAGGKQFLRPTLFSSSGNGSSYVNVPGETNITLIEQSSSPYAAKVTIEHYKPAALAGVVATPTGAPAVDAASPAGSTESEDGWFIDSEGENSNSWAMPDIDLHAYDDKGNHVGMNYVKMEYENNIPSAFASGDLKDAPEWIFVPEGTNVRYELSAEKTKEFLDGHPEYINSAVDKEAKLEYLKFDSDGKRSSAYGGISNVPSRGNAKTQIPSPNDPSLSYSTKAIPGNGNNGGFCCLPGLVLFALFLYAGFYP